MNNYLLFSFIIINIILLFLTRAKKKFFIYILLYIPFLFLLGQLIHNHQEHIFFYSILNSFVNSTAFIFLLIMSLFSYIDWSTKMKSLAYKGIKIESNIYIDGVQKKGYLLLIYISFHTIDLVFNEKFWNQIGINLGTELGSFGLFTMYGFFIYIKYELISIIENLEDMDDKEGTEFLKKILAILQMLPNPIKTNKQKGNKK